MSVERIVMNKRASLTLGDSKMRRHNEVEILKKHQTNTTTRPREHILIHVHLRVSGKPELNRAPAFPFSDCGRFITFNMADVSILQRLGDQ